MFIPRVVIQKFDLIRAKFASTMFSVKETMNTPPLPVNFENLKRFLKSGYSHLKLQLSQCDDIDDILDLISEKSSLTKISLLEAVVDHFKIEQARLIIQQYKKSVEEFCATGPLGDFLNEHFSLPSPLQCETATFLVDRSVDEVTLNDIEDLIANALGETAIIVKVEKINSFVITCSFPLVLSQSLIEISCKNVQLLKEKSVLHVTIGYFELQVNI